MRVLRFDAFTLDQSRRAVLRGGAALELRSQSFDVLNHLVERAAQLVSKQDLFTAVWSGAARTDDSLVQCIKDIRQALGDGDHRIVKTVHGRGYMLVAKVSEAAPAPEAAPPADARLHDAVSGLAAAPQAGWQAPLIAAGLLVAVLAGSGWLVWKHAWPGPPATLTMMTVPSLAVLPVKPLGDETDTALATLADEIATGVWRAPRGFKPEIRPPSAVKDAQGDPKAIGRDLAVRYLVRSSVRRESDVMHINVQIIEAESARQVWVGVFDYRLGQSGAQSRTAARIGRTLAHELLRVEVRRPLPPRPEAGHYTMLGRALITDGNNAKANGEAIAYFEKAIGMEPENFLALAHLARATANGSLNGWLAANEQDEKLAKAEAAIKKVLKDDPTTAASHLVHANVLRAQGEHEQAITALRHALLHNPNLANAHAELGRSLIDVGKADEAIAEIEKAIALSPTDITLYMWTYWAGLAVLHLGDQEAALYWLRKSHQANRAHDNTLRLMAVALADAGREAEAREKIKEFLKLRPDATLDDWKRPNARAHPAVAAPREHFRATLKRLGVPEAKMRAGHAPEHTMMAEPSIAVLPFKPPGDDTNAALAVFADEIAAGMRRAARAFDPDIRPTSAVKDARADPKTIGRELGVRYIVRGLARRENEDLHINVELIEADSMRQVWVGAFDYRPAQTGAQARTAAFIGRTLVAELLRAEVRRPLPAAPGAGHYTMLGRALITEQISAERNRQAIAYFEKVMSIEPNHFLSLVHYARATGGYSLTGWLPESEHEERLAKAEDAVLRALQQEPKSAHAHAAHGHVLRAKGEYPQAIEAFKLALLHNPHFVHARAELGRTLIDIGKPEQAIPEIERAIAMSPTDISLYTWYYWAGLAALHLSDHAGALNWLQRSLQANPSHDNTLRLMAVALADAGQEDDARKTIQKFLKARPGATLDDWRRPNWDSHPEVTARRERIRATLKRLGVPEERAQAPGPAQLTMMAVPSIAVMPFKSAGRKDTALADEIATQLVRVPRGFKIAIKSTAVYKDKVADPRAIGDDLGARYIVLGGVRREGETVRVNVQLIEAETSRQLWAGPFDYAQGEAGAQSRTAAQIARLVTERLLVTESKRPLPAEPQADHYAIMGRAVWAGERDAKVALEAMALFKRGVDKDPNSVPALQGYARAKISAVLSDWAPKDQRSLWLDEAEAAIDRVIAQQRRSYGAYRLRGSLFRARGDWEQAVKALERALDLNSDYAEAHAELGRVKIELGLAHEAAAHIEKALALSPTDSAALSGWCFWAGEAAIHVGDYKAAVHWLERARQANRADKSPALWLAVAYAGLGRDDKARAEMTEYLQSMPGFTLAGWNRSNRRDNPVVAAQRERIATMLNELGVPEREMRTGSTR